MKSFTLPIMKPAELLDVIDFGEPFEPESDKDMQMGIRSQADYPPGGVYVN